MRPPNIRAGFPALIIPVPPKKETLITWKFGEITLTEKYPEYLDGDDEGDTEDDTTLHASTHID